MSYSDFARFYDILTENINYNEIAEYYNGILEKRGVRKGCLLDLACGSGNLSIPLSEYGYNVFGADVSHEMLTMAANKSDKIHWICADMTKLSFENQFDAVVCALDSLNHLEDQNQIQDSFNGIFQSLKSGGVFAADLNTPYKHKFVLADNAFTFDYEGLFCGWQNELEKDSPLLPVEMFLDFFSENNDGSYTRYSDYVREIALPWEAVEDMLKKSGFSHIEIEEYLTAEALTEKSEKFTVIARKN